MPAFPFLGGAYLPQSRATDAQTCVNLYSELREAPKADAEGLSSLSPTPGLRLLATVPTGGPIRGLYTTQGGRCFVAAANGLYELSSSNTLTLHGIWPYGVSPMRMSDNGVQLLIVGGSNGYLFTLGTNGFATVSAAAFYGSETVDFVDGYFVLIRQGTNQFYISNLYAGGTYDPLAFASAEGSPDILMSVLVDHREVWLFGQFTTEVWFNAGGSPFPFSRIAGAYMEQGTLAPHSVASLDNTVFWLGQNTDGARIVWRAQGYQPQRISTHPVEYSLGNQAHISEAVAYVYQQGGHSFYVLNCDTTTWVFDAATGLWHERRYLDAGTFTRHRANSHCTAFGKHIVGDYADGRVYDMSLDVYTDDIDPIVRERTCQSVGEDRAWVHHQRLELLMETGVGLDAGVIPGANPSILVDFSDDYGASWSSPVYGSPGSIGARQTRVVWRRLGRSRDRLYRARISDPVKTVFVGALLQAELGGK